MNVKKKGGGGVVNRGARGLFFRWEERGVCPRKESLKGYKRSRLEGGGDSPINKRGKEGVHLSLKKGGKKLSARFARWDRAHHFGKRGGGPRRFL